jgi:BRCT domain type II-containing protein
MTDIPIAPEAPPPSLSTSPHTAIPAKSSSMSSSSLSLADQLAVKRQQLSNVTSSQVKGSDAPKLTGYATRDEVKSYYDDCLDINLEQWINHIHQHTFITAMVPLTIDDARALITVYKEMKRSQAQIMTSTQRARYDVRVSIMIEID